MNERMTITPDADRSLSFVETEKGRRFEISPEIELYAGETYVIEIADDILRVFQVVMDETTGHSVDIVGISGGLH